MEITKYASQSCIRCKMLDKMLKHLKIEDVKSVMLEDVGTDFLLEKGISSFPTLVFNNGSTEKKLSGNILPQDITDTIKELS